MVQLREANEDRSDKDKMFISEDLTTVRKELFFKTRTLKKQGQIKSTCTRDGKIILKLDDDDTKCYITTQSDLEAVCTKFKLPLPQLKTKQNNNNQKKKKKKKKQKTTKRTIQETLWNSTLSHSY